MGDSFLMPTKRRTALNILSKLAIEIFAEDNFAEFSFAIDDPTHRSFSRKKIEKYALLTKTLLCFKENIQKMDLIHKINSTKCKIFVILNYNRKLRKKILPQFLPLWYYQYIFFPKMEKPLLPS